MPLNEFIFHYEKYDGSSRVDRFWRSVPRIHHFMGSKVGYIMLNIILVYPLAFSFLIFFLGPFYIFWLIKGGIKYASDQSHNLIDYLMKKSEPYTGQGENKIAILDRLRGKYLIIIYYSSSIVPVNEQKKKEFIHRLEKMKERLQVKEVVEVNSKENLLDVIQRLDINVSESFFMSDGKIDLNADSLFPLLMKGQSYSEAASKDNFDLYEVR